MSLSIGSGVGFREHGNETLGSIKCGNFSTTAYSSDKLISKLAIREVIATLVRNVDTSRMKGCFIVYRENIQVLGINVCSRQQQQ
jgi:hypothetical protein